MAKTASVKVKTTAAPKASAASKAPKTPKIARFNTPTPEETVVASKAEDTAQESAAVTAATDTLKPKPKAEPKPHAAVLPNKLPRVPSKHREYFTSNLASLSKAGLPVGWSLQTLQDNTSSAALRQAIQQMRHDIDDGSPFWKALDRAHLVSPETLMLCRIGEESGNLPENLRLAAQQEEKQRMFKSKIRTAMMYPSFVLSTTLVVGLGIAWFLLPRLAHTFENLGVKLPLISRLILGFGTFLQHYGLVVVGGTALLLVGLGIALATVPAVKRVGRQLAFMIPGIGRLLREVELARFGYLMGSLLAAGIQVTESLRLLRGATTQPSYQAFYDHLSHSFDEGYNFRVTFAKKHRTTLLIPGPVQQMIIAGEYSGTLADTLKNVGAMYEDKANVTAGNLETLLEPIMLVLVWIGVLAVAVGVILPIYSLVGNLNHT